MSLLKRFLLTAFLPLLLVALLLAACGSSTTGSSAYGSGSTPTTAATTAPTVAPTATAPSSSGSGAITKTAAVTVSGKSETVLTNAAGLTLYYRTSDTATSVCSGGCAQAWPPLLFSGTGTPTSADSLPGALSVVSDTNGSQVAYQGHPLYTYSGDTAAGQATGQGLANVWFVATPTLATASAGGSSSSSGSYGY